MLFRGDDSTDLGSEGQRAIVDLIINQLDTHGVTRKNQTLVRYVPDGDAKHAIEVIKNVAAPLLISVNNHFGVRPCPEMMAALFKFSAQFLKVIDLAVKDHPDRFFGVGHGLVSAG